MAEAARDTAGPDLVAAVDEELANYWMANLQYSQQAEEGEQTWLVVRAARCAAPYLLRRHRWYDLGLVCERLLQRDPSVAAAGLVLPMLTTAVQTNTDTGLAFGLGRTQASALRRIDADQAETRYHDLLEIALAAEDFANASLVSGDLVNLYRNQGRLDAALTLADSKIDYSRRAGHGPWTQLGDQTLRLQIRRRLGHDREVLDAGLELHDQMAALPDPPRPYRLRRRHV